MLIVNFRSPYVLNCFKKYVCIQFYNIPPHRNGKDSCATHPWKLKLYTSYIVKTMAGDALAPCIIWASGTMLLTQFALYDRICLVQNPLQVKTNYQVVMYLFLTTIERDLIFDEDRWLMQWETLNTRKLITTDYCYTNSVVCDFSSTDLNSAWSSSTFLVFLCNCKGNSGIYDTYMLAGSDW